MNQFDEEELRRALREAADGFAISDGAVRADPRRGARVGRRR